MSLRRTFVVTAAVAAAAAMTVGVSISSDDPDPASLQGCVQAPLDGGGNCLGRWEDPFHGRRLGWRYNGAGNAFPARDSNGDPSCEPVGCAVLFGDNPDVDL